MKTWFGHGSNLLYTYSDTQNIGPVGPVIRGRPSSGVPATALYVTGGMMKDVRVALRG